MSVTYRRHCWLEGWSSLVLKGPSHCFVNKIMLCYVLCRKGDFIHKVGNLSAGVLALSRVAFVNVGVIVGPIHCIKLEKCYYSLRNKRKKKEEGGVVKCGDNWCC